uniref:Uncharacterized protein n=1 Tax=Salix viminalis TaxID=40686 RepID=A0A6N2N3K3_SALVM
MGRSWIFVSKFSIAIYLLFKLLHPRRLAGLSGLCGISIVRCRLGLPCDPLRRIRPPITTKTRPGGEGPYGGWPGGGGLGIVGVLPMRSQVRIRSGANNSLGLSDLDETLDLTVVHLWETYLPRPCAPPGLVRPSGLDTRG